MKKLVERNRYLAFTIAIVIYLLLDLGIKFIFGDNDFALTLRSIVPLEFLERNSLGYTLLYYL